MFLLVYALELMILIPCGSFHDIMSCDLPPASRAFWQAYFELDPLFLEMPAWLVTVMSIQDYLFNPLVGAQPVYVLDRSPANELV